MSTRNPGVRQPDEFSFESYVERQFVSLHERLGNMSIDIEGLEVDETTLATVIPAIATGMSDLHTSLTNDEAALTQAVADKEAAVKAATEAATAAQSAADATALATAQTELTTATAALAKAEGELGRVAAVKAALDPIVEQAKTLVPAAPAAPPAA